VLLVPISLTPWIFGYTGAVYGISALVLGIGFLVGVWRVARDKQDAAGVSLTRDAPARAAFRYSIIYLFVLFAALAVDEFVALAVSRSVSG
jgi:protoheme IX farnesyltransferase